MADQEPTQQELFQEALAPPVSPPTEEQVSAQPEAEPPAPEPVPPPQPPEAAQGIPAWRLKEEMDARREAEAKLRQYEQWAAQQRAQQAPPANEDPTTATTRLIVQQLQPFVEHTHMQMMAIGKMVADNAYGADAVNEAEQAFLAAKDDRTLDPVDYERVVQAPNRYAEVVRWHQNQSVVQTVGGDLNAWFEKQLEAKLADPKFQASMLEKVKAGAAPGTAVKLPPSLSKVTAARGNGTVADDGSDASLFAFAMGKGTK